MFQRFGKMKGFEALFRMIVLPTGARSIVMHQLSFIDMEEVTAEFRTGLDDSPRSHRPL